MNRIKISDVESDDELVYRLCKGLPASYDNLLEIIRQTSNGTGVKLLFDDIVKRLREHQILQRNKTTRAEAHAAFERALYTWRW